LRADTSESTVHEGFGGEGSRERKVQLYSVLQTIHISVEEN